MKEFKKIKALKNILPVISFLFLYFSLFFNIYAIISKT